MPCKGIREKPILNKVRTLELERALALHFMHYNFCRKHLSIKTTPTIKAGLTDRLWTLHELARLPELMDGGLAAKIQKGLPARRAEFRGRDITGDDGDAAAERRGTPQRSAPTAVVSRGSERWIRRLATPAR